MTIANKYGARRTWSNLCQRMFDSRKEAIRGEELTLLEKAGEIKDLEFQPKFILSEDPKLTYTADFRYVEDGQSIVEDAKGMMTEATRVRIVWLKQRTGIEVKIV